VAYYIRIKGPGLLQVVWRETTTFHTTVNWLYILRRRRFGSKGEKAVIQAREKAEKF
jgi:hypothetical protein